MFKIFKKTILILTTAVLIVGFSVFSQAAEKGTLKLTLLGGSTGGLWHTMCEGFAESIRKEHSGALINVTAGSDAGNLIRLENQEAEFGLAYSPTVRAAMAGIEPFKTTYSKLRAITYIFPAIYQFYALERLPVKSFEEVKEKKYPLRIGMNTHGSVMDIISQKTLSFYGIALDDLTKRWGGKLHFISTGAGNDLMKAGQLDAQSGFGPVPMTLIMEAAPLGLSLYSINDSVANKLSEALGLEKVTISKEKYEFLKKDIFTVQGAALLMTTTDVPEGTVYLITKALEKNRSYLGTVHAALKGLDPKQMSKTAGVTLHSGAQKYYKEIGALD